MCCKLKLSKSELFVVSVQMLPKDILHHECLVPVSGCCGQCETHVSLCRYP